MENSHLLFGIHGGARLGTIRIGEGSTEEGRVRARRREEWPESEIVAGERERREKREEEENEEMREEVAF